MDWILLLKIIAVTIAALLGVLGVIFEYRKDGKLTLGGKATILTIVAASIIAGVLESMMAADSRNQMQKMLDGIDKTLKPIGDEKTLSASLSGRWTDAVEEIELIIPTFDQHVSNQSCAVNSRQTQGTNARPLCHTDQNGVTTLEGLLFCTDSVDSSRFPFERHAKSLRLHVWVLNDVSDNSIRDNWHGDNKTLSEKVENVRSVGLYLRFKPKNESNCRSTVFRYYSGEQALHLDTELEVEFQSADGSIRSYRDLEDSILITKLEIWTEPQSADMQDALRNLISKFEINRLEIEPADGVQVPISAFDSVRLKDAYRKKNLFNSQINVYKTPGNEKSLLGINLQNKPSYGIPSVYGDAEYVQ